jgi:hypothetical protein
VDATGESRETVGEKLAGRCRYPAGPASRILSSRLQRRAETPRDRRLGRGQQRAGLEKYPDVLSVAPVRLLRIAEAAEPSSQQLASS